MTTKGVPHGDGRRFAPAEIPHQAAPGFANRANRITVRKIDLTNVRTETEIDITANVIWAVDASDLDAVLNIKFNSQAGAGVDFRRGMLIGGVPFSTLFITNEAQSAKTITIAYAVEEPSRGFRIENPLIGFQNVKNDQPDTLVGSGDTAIANTNTDTIAANSSRRELTIQADKDNTGVLILEDENNNAFAEIEAGGSMTIPGTVEVIVNNSSGASQTYRYSEIED